MVDYTTKQNEGSGIGLYLAAGAVVAVLLYALFAGGGGTTVDPATLGEGGDAAIAPATDTTEGLAPAETAPVVTE